MKVSERLQQRRENWQELELLCEQIKSSKKSMGQEKVTRFAGLYRAACADLALADAYQLPPNTVDYLHRLVGRAHNQLYRGSQFNLSSWAHLLFFEAPQRIFADRCVQVAFCVFWGVFILSAVLAYSQAIWPSYAEQIIGQEMIDQLETNFKEPMKGRDVGTNYAMAGFYIYHNTGIGLKCFSFGLAVVPGIFICVFNAGVLGASFGYMARPEVVEGPNFFHFVTAHGPFELTAIVLAAGTGLRLGFSWIYTEGYSRAASLRRAGEYCMPMMGATMLLFFLAALIEGFLSPSSAPYWVKAAVAILSSGALTFYFVVLGYPRTHRELI